MLDKILIILFHPVGHRHKLPLPIANLRSSLLENSSARSSLDNVLDLLFLERLGEVLPFVVELDLILGK